MENWNEIKDTANTYLEVLTSERWFDADFDEVAGFIYDKANDTAYDCEIIHSDEIEFKVKARIEEWGWQAVKTLLQNVQNVHSEYYEIDAYGAISDLTHEKLATKLEALLEAIEEQEQDNE